MQLGGALDMNNPMMMQVDSKFKELCFTIQNERIVAGKETIKGKMSVVRVTRMIANMINSNQKIFDSLVEAEIGKNK